jgi:aminoglycoside 6'-N-acetyltransferase I
LTVRAIEPAEWPEWARMRAALWPDQTAAQHEAEMPKWAARDDTVVLVAVGPDGRLCGFAEVGTRPYADGCETSPVAFLEGWFVDEDARGAGYGRMLVDGAEAWARARGLQELASDALLENEASHRAHEHVGFTEVERAVRYRKRLTDPWLF